MKLLTVLVIVFLAANLWILLEQGANILNIAGLTATSFALGTIYDQSLDK